MPKLHQSRDFVALTSLSARWLTVLTFSLLVPSLVGCGGGNPFLAVQPARRPNASQAPAAGNASGGSTWLSGNSIQGSQGSADSSQTIAQLQDLRQRVAQLDATNRDLTAQMSQAQQLFQAEREQKRLIQQQLAEAAGRLRETTTVSQEMERKVQTLQASTQRSTPSATITANSTVKQSLRMVEVAGLDVRQEGSVVRVEAPVEKLFKPGSPEIDPRAFPILDDISDALRKSYPRQLIVIEGHIDGTHEAAKGAPTAGHQVATAYAQNVLDYLVKRGRISPSQLSTMSFGAYRPKFSSAAGKSSPRNNRVEIVIYPDTVDE